MSQAMMNLIASLSERLEAIEEKLERISVPVNGMEKTAFIEARVMALENKYMAMNARMGKRE